MTTSIYAQHYKHFATTSAAAVLRGSEHVANVTIKYPRDGAGRLYAYVHWIGTELVRGSASGGEYDKATAACAAAAREVPHAGANTWMDSFFSALAKDDGQRWADALRHAGFTVLEVV